MDSRQLQLAVQLLRTCANNAKCNNNKLLQRLEEHTKRKGEALPFYGDEDGSRDERTLLPTLATLDSAMKTDLLICQCPLCQPSGIAEFGGDENESAVMNNETKLKDYAILILCGCLFITRHSAFTASESLIDFIYSYYQSRKENNLSIFSGIAEQPSECRLPHDHDSSSWDKVDDMNEICNTCRWKAFEDAYKLKRRIVSVYNMPRSMSWSTNPREIVIPDLNEKNFPFVDQRHLLDIKKSTIRINLNFYSCKIHSIYNDSKVIQLQGVKIFRKVYRYRHPHENDRISQAKKEAKMARAMSQHENIAPLLFAFSHKNRDYEVIELLYKLQEGNLEKLLLGRLLQPNQLDLIIHSSIELVDNFLWRAMVDIVEAVVNIHSTLGSSSPLDIKPANILVGMNEKEGLPSLYLTDFGHIAETNPRKATIEYAPPLPSTESGIGQESSTTYDVWSMACTLLQVLVFINANCDPSNFEDFNSERQLGFQDAAFWTDKDGRTRLKESVAKRLSKLREGKGHRTLQVISKIHDMLSIDPEARSTMEGCLQLFKSTKYTRWPRGQDHMMCGSERWMVKYRTGRLEQRYTAKLAVYRDSKTAAAALTPAQQRQERRKGISIELNLGDDPPVQDENECHLITFAPAAFWLSEDDQEGDDVGHDDNDTRDLESEDTRTESKQSKDQGKEDGEALFFNGLHANNTFLLPRREEYRKFVTLVTRQEIKRKLSSNSTDFLIKGCRINDKTSYVDGNVQLWHLLSEDEYDSRYKRTSQYGTISRRPSNAHVNLKPKGLTDWKLLFWMHRSSTRERICVVLDIGEKTWKLDDKPDKPLVVIKQINLLPWEPKMRAAIFLQQESTRRRTEEEYPFIPIDAEKLHKSLDEKVIKKMEIHFSSLEGKFLCRSPRSLTPTNAIRLLEKVQFIRRLKHSGFLQQQESA